ncbi:DUF421 domain-containing protein [Sphingobacterium sp.]|jgi:uncharacterized membrane protein YcaP (DUF421 family)|uniref:DUF421 domain-containing protein n=1 Tax=Sphingobacterium sp. TaxID=341027 RepID=UPI0028A2AFA3|nr:YetF domain-containing protein [Sphingobacterium sp.]
MIDFQKIFADGVDFSFLVEIGARTVIMFLLILIILRLSGRRGVRQLTVFEVAIIISLGSAAGDPMFQEDLPIFYSIVVFICVILVYKSITWLASRSEKLTQLLEGKVLPVVKDGVFDIQHENDNTFSKMEFFSELRNLNVEHLGQVREGVLEIDGTLSVLFYADSDVRYGLPLFPSAYKAVTSLDSSGPYACMYCGNVLFNLEHDSVLCPRCNRKKWCKALNNKRV